MHINRTPRDNFVASDAPYSHEMPVCDDFMSARAKRLVGLAAVGASHI